MESIFPKDLQTCQDWSMPALKSVMELAERYKLERQAGIPHNQILAGKILYGGKWRELIANNSSILERIELTNIKDYIKEAEEKFNL